MAEIFRSALNYISQTGKSGNDFVGQYVELGPVQLRVRRVIAEGNLLFLSVRWTLVRSVSFVRECYARFKTANLIYSFNVNIFNVFFFFRRIRVCFCRSGHVDRKRICPQGKN